MDRLARGILKGVAEAHRWGIVHRDLKPDNVLLQLTETDVVPKVADFGLAKLLGPALRPDAALTLTGQRMGTPGYMSPEQAEDVKRVDARSDLYALGVVFYEMLCGKHPFIPENPSQIASALGRQPLHPLPPDVPRRISEAIAAAMVVDRTERIGSCEAMIDVWRGEAPAVWDVATLRRLVEGPIDDPHRAIRFAVVASHPTLTPAPVPSRAPSEAEPVPRGGVDAAPRRLRSATVVGILALIAACVAAIVAGG